MVERVPTPRGAAVRDTCMPFIPRGLLVLGFVRRRNTSGHRSGTVARRLLPWDRRVPGHHDRGRPCVVDRNVHRLRRSGNPSGSRRREPHLDALLLSRRAARRRAPPVTRLEFRTFRRTSPAATMEARAGDSRPMLWDSTLTADPGGSRTGRATSARRRRASSRCATATVSSGTACAWPTFSSRSPPTSRGSLTSWTVRIATARSPSPVALKPAPGGGAGNARQPSPRLWGTRSPRSSLSAELAGCAFWNNPVDRPI